MTPAPLTVPCFTSCRYGPGRKASRFEIEPRRHRYRRRPRWRILCGYGAGGDARLTRAVSAAQVAGCDTGRAPHRGRTERSLFDSQAFGAAPVFSPSGVVGQLAPASYGWSNDHYSQGSVPIGKFPGGRCGAGGRTRSSRWRVQPHRGAGLRLVRRPGGNQSAGNQSAGPPGNDRARRRSHSD